MLKTFLDNWKTWNICIWTGKHFQGLHFFGKQARDPEEFKAAVRWWLGGPIRLGLVPAIWLLVPEVGLRFERLPDFQKPCFFKFSRPWIPGQQGLAGANPLWDWPNNFNYMFIFVFGYAIAATEELGVRESLGRARWFYFVAGLIISSLKMSMPKLGEQLTNGLHPWAYGVIDGTFK